MGRGVRPLAATHHQGLTSLLRDAWAAFAREDHAVDALSPVFIAWDGYEKALRAWMGADLPEPLTELHRKLDRLMEIFGMASQAPARTWNFGTRAIVNQAAHDIQQHLRLLEFLMPLAAMEVEALASEDGEEG